ncbi:MAG: response regulator [Deltaproteobacteria bacterium]|nr:response regulator [Deltaproteobacteria bacterium]
MDPIRVMIVEDDCMVAKINRDLTHQISGFKVVQVAGTAREAIEALEKEPVDLIILDVYLPDRTGVELLKSFRHGDHPVDVVMITAAHDAPTVEECMRYGIFDYIIKPFPFDRYKACLMNYRKQRAAISCQKILNQERVNEFTGFREVSPSRGGLPKGIQEQTLRRVEDAIGKLGPSFSIEDLIEALPLSRATNRRYLEFLTDRGALEKSFAYRKLGRPTVRYAKVGEGG